MYCERVSYLIRKLPELLLPEGNRLVKLLSFSHNKGGEGEKQGQKHHLLRA